MAKTGNDNEKAPEQEDENKDWLKDLRDFSDRDFGEDEEDPERRRDPLRQMR